jgi:pyruvate,orthophosphate dikinase
MSKNSAQNKWVYLFREGNAEMRELLGGKGAGLAEMTRANLPVPPGFTITTETCSAYYDLGKKFPADMWDQVITAIVDLENQTGKQFGSTDNPLLVSVRSGSSVSMPGMMDTVLNLGLNNQTLEGLKRTTGGERFAYDSYRRFIQMFGKIVLGIPGNVFEGSLESYKNKVGAKNDSDLTAEQFKHVATNFERITREKTGAEFPQDPYIQLSLAIEAVLASWNGRRAIDYRNFYAIPHDIGTAINIVAMVFGNMDENSGTGVAFTRNPSTGEKTLYGEYLINAQGEDVVAGIRTPDKISQMSQSFPDLYEQLNGISQLLESHYRDVQDMEFTVEKGTLYMLQTRSAKRTAQAAAKVAVDMVKEGLITKEEAIQRVEPEQVNQLLLPRFDEQAKTNAITKGNLLTVGLNASPGAATGNAVFDPDRAVEFSASGVSVILVRTETNPDDIHGMLKSMGVLTSRGGATSHAAVVARGLGKPCVSGCEDLIIDHVNRTAVVNHHTIRENEEISIDGATGEVFIGSIATTEPNFSEQYDLNTLLAWANETKRMGVWANADTPEDAKRALDYGAQGIGLCRTEHMFFGEDRLPIMRQMIMSAGEATYTEAKLQQLQSDMEKASRNQNNELAALIEKEHATLANSVDLKYYHDSLLKLLSLQTQDFTGILKVMTGKPVIIRLLDPPLHEFLPRYEELLLELADLRRNGTQPDLLKEQERTLKIVETLRETNPMLGLRGCRLGLMYGAINEMQARAIITAACDLVKDGWDPQPEIMVPLVGHANELRIVREELEKVAEAVQKEKGIKIDYKIGTMIELPRAAITANQIAVHSDFFSFGTNDLTQTTYGFSRDDAESKFLLQYVERGIIPENPFQVLDRDGVGTLIKIAVELGRKYNPELEIGICGEHGGDPSSIEFCYQVGLDYVSCSPFRVPVARLAAAQAALSPSN